MVMLHSLALSMLMMRHPMQLQEQLPRRQAPLTWTWPIQMDMDGLRGKAPTEPTVLCGLLVLSVAITTVLILALGPVRASSSLKKPQFENPQEEEEISAPADTLAHSERHQSCSILRIAAMTSINLAYGFAMACQGLLVIPSEAKSLWPHHSSEAIGAMAIIAGLSQLAGPEAGYFSDTYRSPLGRRRPILIMGVAVMWTTSFGCWLMSTQEWRGSFMFMFFLQQMAWNIIYATSQGLVPDLVGKERHGLAGSASAAHVLVGALGAFLSLNVFSHVEYHWYYGFTGALAVATCTLVCVAALETSTEHNIVAQHQCLSVIERYTLDISQNWDFFLLLVTKTIYCALVISKGFLLYFLRDAFAFTKPSEESHLLALLGQVSMAAEGAAVIAALTVMFYFDTGSAVGAEGMPLVNDAAAPRKPWYQWAVCFGTLWMAIWWNGPTFMALQRAIEPMSAGHDVGSWTTFMLVGNFIWGLGQGAYLAGDQAMSLALLPDKRQASRYLSFNCLCAFVGSSVGGVIVGGLLGVLGAGAEKGYAFPGYVGVFLYASLLSVAISVVSIFIRVDRKSRKGEAFKCP
jgi:MFS family permease